LIGKAGSDNLLAIDSGMLQDVMDRTVKVMVNLLRIMLDPPFFIHVLTMGNRHFRDKFSLMVKQHRFGRGCALVNRQNQLFQDLFFSISNNAFV
jgi:hypothetical protein